MPTATASGAMNYWNGTAWVEVAPTVNEGATLQMIGGVPTWTGGTPPPPSIGDTHAGGIIFWVDPNDNTKGKVIAPSYGPNDLKQIDAVTYCEDLIEGGYDDWYLPSKDELKLMYDNLKANNLGGLSGDLHWSSTVHDTYYAWYKDFYCGDFMSCANEWYADKNWEALRVRAVRAY